MSTAGITPIINLFVRARYIIFFAVMLVVMFPSNYRLSHAKSSPMGVVSLEVAFSQSGAEVIRRDWDTASVTVCDLPWSRKCVRKHLLREAAVNTGLDFLFIIAYGLLLLSINKKMNRNSRKGELVRRLIIIACCCDALENVGMLSFLFAGVGHIAWLWSSAAVVKFGLLAVVVLWGLGGAAYLVRQLAGFSRITKDVLQISALSPLTVLSLLVLFFTLWLSDEGQDLLLVINNNELGPVSLYVVVVILAFMNWHFPKFFYNRKWDDKTLRRRLARIPVPANWWIKNRLIRSLFVKPFNYSSVQRTRKPNRISIPRLFGVLTFLIPAFGVLKTLGIFKVAYFETYISPMGILLIVTIAIQRCFGKEYFVKFYNYRWTQRLFYIICTVLLLLPLLLWPFNKSRSIDIGWIFIGMLGYGVLFALVLSNRSSLMKKIKWLNNKYITPVIWISTLFPIALFVYYFTCNVFLWKGIPVSFLTLAVVLSGIITYYVLFTILTVLGKIYSINFSLLLVLLLVLLPTVVNNHYHYIATVPTTKTRAEPLNSYIARWVDERAKIKMPKDSVYRIYLVNTYGGGIRAAAWTCLVMNKLDSLEYAKNGDLFQDHVLAYSGASGGTVGASVLCANKYINKVRLPDSLYSAFFNNDYLTSVVTGVIGSDLWFAGLPACEAKDRSWVQEHMWEQYFEKYFGSGVYGWNADTIWDGRTSVPLLFSNSTDVKFGTKGVFAPVSLDSPDFTDCTVVRRLFESGQSLKLSTAAFMSARFPYLSPAGAFKAFNERHHFLDGGMVENSGAETAMQVYNVLERYISARKDYAGKFKVYMISLKNSYLKEDSTEVETKRNISQLMAPVTAAMSVGVTGNTQKADGANAIYFTPNNAKPLIGGYYKVLPINMAVKIPVHHIGRHADTVTATVPLPLGWSISDKALERLCINVVAMAEDTGILYRIVHPAN